MRLGNVGKCRGISMKYRVYDKVTRQDITDKYYWVLTPDGKLYYMEYDLIGYPNAMVLSERAANELEAERIRKRKLKGK